MVKQKYFTPAGSRLLQEVHAVWNGVHSEPFLSVQKMDDSN